MTLNLQKLTQGAQVSTFGSRAEIHPTSFREILRTDGGTVLIGEEIDGDLMPGTLYRIRTGIKFENTHWSQILVRACSAAFMRGLNVWRHEVASDGELVAYVIVLARLRFDKMQPMIEVMPCGGSNHEVNDTGAPFVTDTSKPVPTLAFREPVLNQRSSSPLDQTPISDVKRVTDWLNSDDGKGIVGESTESRGTLPRIMSPAEAINAGAVPMKT